VISSIALTTAEWVGESALKNMVSTRSGALAFKSHCPDLGSALYGFLRSALHQQHAQIGVSFVTVGKNFQCNS
jgi:hypothetical protein